jgi:undecaprenyl-diphosphatase
LVGGWAVAARRPVPDAERRLFDAVNGWPDVVSDVLRPVMQLGSLWAVFVVAALCLLAWRRSRPALDVLVAGVAAWWLAQGVKGVVERGRPSALLADVTVRERGVEGWGFVSGHSAVAFAIATALAPSLRWPGRVGVYGVASLVALARTTHGVHLPADVVGGAGLGLLCGAAAVAAFDRFSPDDEQTATTPDRATSGD